MFTISPALMRQCIEMVANEFDYIYPADGIDENYSVTNLGADGVWIVDNMDDSRVQQIVLMYTCGELDYARKYRTPLLYI